MSKGRQIVERDGHPYVALIPFDESLAPLVASAELTRDYITADNLFQKYLASAYDFQDAEGHTHIIVPKDAQFWFRQKFEIAKVIATLNQTAGVKEIDTQLDLLKMIMTDNDILSQEMKKEIAKKFLEKKAHGKPTIITDIVVEPTTH